MAYTTPKTWTVGEVLTAANLNTHLRDNVAFLATPPGCALYQTAGTSLTHNSDTVVLFDTEAEDNATLHSTASNTGRVTASIAGRWLFTACVQFPSNTTGIRGISFKKNGATQYNGLRVPNVSSGGFADIISLSKIIRLAAADYVELLGYQNTGGALTSTPGVGATTLEAIWVSL